MANTGVTKRCMGNVPMFVCRFKSGNENRSTRQQVAIQGFPKLKENSTYLKEVPETGFHVNITKRRHNVTVELHVKDGIGHLYTVTCFVLYDHFVHSDPIEADKIPVQAFRMFIPRKMIQDARNVFSLQKGMLVFELRISRESRLTHIYPVSNQRKLRKEQILASANKDQILLTRDLASYSEREKHTDFLIHLKTGDVNNNSVRVAHKALLAARSKFFYDSIAKNRHYSELELDIPREVFDELLYFCYYGNIHLCNLKMLPKVLEAAEKLKMGRLEDLCTDYLEIYVKSASINKGREIKEADRKNELEKLLKIADDLAKMRQQKSTKGRG